MKKKLLSMLVCPKCKGPLVYQSIGKSRKKLLICQKDGLAYPVRKGVPVLLDFDACDIVDRDTADINTDI
jgi:uncharacterized protein YbaR (Trm112 family)